MTRSAHRLNNHIPTPNNDTAESQRTGVAPAAGPQPPLTPAPFFGSGDRTFIRHEAVQLGTVIYLATAGRPEPLVTVTHVHPVGEDDEWALVDFVDAAGQRGTIGCRPDCGFPVPTGDDRASPKSRPMTTGGTYDFV